MDERQRLPLRQVTTCLTEAVYLRLLAAKAQQRKPFKTLVAEGCALIAAEIRLRAEQERALGLPVMGLLIPAPALGTYRKVTGEVSDAVYLDLIAARHHVRLSLKVLAAEGCRRIGDHYYQQRKERTP